MNRVISTVELDLTLISFHTPCPCYIQYGSMVRVIEKCFVIGYFPSNDLYSSSVFPPHHINTQYSFAGPTFNLLVGLGCGLLTQKEALLSDEGLPIALMQSVRTGFVFLICNCLMAVFGGIWNKGVIPKM